MNDRDALVHGGYISKKKHPESDIFILNYTPKTQYENFWNETTTQCRGLIVDGENNILSRCFKKFFNYSEVKTQADEYLKNKNFSVYEKCDGSLGISYFLNNVPYIATRGSFESYQSIKANEILRSKKIKLDPKLTYLFEIIFPENRIVVNYGSKEDLVLLSVIETDTGKELDIHSCDFGFSTCQKIECKEFKELDLNKNNFEGYVIKFDDGFRFKLKLEEYVRLHKILFGLSSRDIWESLKLNKSLDLDHVPDEIYNWIKSTKKQIEDEYSEIEYFCKNKFLEIKCENRKQFAEKALKNDHYGILFKMYDEKPYEELIWEKVRPRYYTYKENIDEE